MQEIESRSPVGPCQSSGMGMPGLKWEYINSIVNSLPCFRSIFSLLDSFDCDVVVARSYNVQSICLFFLFLASLCQEPITYSPLFCCSFICTWRYNRFICTDPLNGGRYSKIKEKSNEWMNQTNEWMRRESQRPKKLKLTADVGTQKGARRPAEGFVRNKSWAWEPPTAKLKPPLPPGPPSV